ncbi:hypothetical protein KI387_009266 [Taxus chinensis]|uniref:DNA repair RAD52-like protein 1, mitochondrial n=1 Tax=Taxus chinensis TaxID=29808 RepID=A0AA38CSD5_TAXCH|nr:hypothetical protein KI387_009266 [Taxus chinensis]
MALCRALLRNKRDFQPNINVNVRHLAPTWLKRLQHNNAGEETPSSEVPSLNTGRSLADVLQDLNRRVPDKLIRTRVEDGYSSKYIPWHIVNRIMNLHAQEWSGEVRGITYSTDGKSVSVVYRVTIYGVDGEMYRESTGTSSASDTNFGDPVQKAEAMAFRRACARFGLGLHLYHEELN